MSINEVMKIATDGMNTAQRQEEKERRVEVVGRINKIIEKIAGCGADKSKQRRYKKQLETIKAEESGWLKQVAWFMY